MLKSRDISDKCRRREEVNGTQSLLTHNRMAPVTYRFYSTFIKITTIAFPSHRIRSLWALHRRSLTGHDLSYLKMQPSAANPSRLLIPQATRTTHKLVTYSDISLWDAGLACRFSRHNQTRSPRIGFMLYRRSRVVLSRVPCQRLNIRKSPLMLTDRVQADGWGEALAGTRAIGRGFVNVPAGRLRAFGDQNAERGKAGHHHRCTKEPSV